MTTPTDSLRDAQVALDVAGKAIEEARSSVSAALVRMEPVEPEPPDPDNPANRPHYFNPSRLGTLCFICGSEEGAAIHLRVEPEPPAPVPPVEPPAPTPPPIPATLHIVEWEFADSAGERVAGRAATTDTELNTQAGPCRLVAIWEDAPHGERAPCSVFLVNGMRGAGIVRINRLRVKVDGFVVLAPSGAQTIFPRSAIPATTIDLGYLADLRLYPLAGLRHYPKGFPEQIRMRALADVDAARAEHVGPYPFAIPMVDGGSDSVAPGGRATAPYHGGARDWLVDCPEGMLYRLTFALDATARAGLWAMEDNGEPWLPAAHGLPYWWDASTLQYAREWEKTHGPGWGWSTNQLDYSHQYEMQLALRKLADFAHARRWYGAIMAIAPDLRLGTWLAKNLVWPELKRSYSMDPRSPRAPGLYAPLWEVLERTAPGQPNAPPNASGWGNRREAHAAMIVSECARYLPEREWRPYAEGFTKLFEQLDDGRGVLDRGCTGDAKLATTTVGTPLFGACPVAMFFHQAMISQACLWLAELPGMERARVVGDRIARWWGVDPPYFAHTGGAHRSAVQAPHKRASTNGWGWITAPKTLPKGLDALLAQTAFQGLGCHIFDYVPAWMRPWR